MQTTCFVAAALWVSCRGDGNIVVPQMLYKQLYAAAAFMPSNIIYICNIAMHRDISRSGARVHAFFMWLQCADREREWDLYTCVTSHIPPFFRHVVIHIWLCARCAVLCCIVRFVPDMLCGVASCSILSNTLSFYLSLSKKNAISTLDKLSCIPCIYSCELSRTSRKV